MPDTVPFPHPWKEDTIGSKAEVTVGGTPSTAVARYWGGNLPWMSSGDVHLRRISDVPGRITQAGLRASAAKLVEPPAVAIALAGQGKTRGTAALTELTLCTNQSVALIRPQDEELDARYLYHALDYRYEELRARSAGGGRAGLTKQIVQDVPVPLPHPKEQSHIAETLDSLDAAIRETEAVVAKLRQVKAGLLHDLLTRGLDKHGQLRDPARNPDQFQHSPLGLLPKAWRVCPLEEVIESAVDGPFGSNLKTSHYVSEPGIRVVRLQNIAIGEFLDDDRAYVSDEHAKSLSRHEVKAGDLLVASLGDENHPLARACLFPDGSPPGIVKADCFRLRAAPERAINGFLMLHLNCPARRGLVYRLGQGVTRDRLNLGTLMRMLICRPEVREQEKIVERWRGIETRLGAESNSLSKLHFLKRGLAHDLLTGRVRVNSFNQVDKS